MNGSTLHLQHPGILLAGLLSVLVGLVILLARRSARKHPILVVARVLALSLMAGVGLALASGQDELIGLPPIVVASAWLVVLVLRRAHALTALLRSVPCQAVCLTVLGLGGLIGWARWSESPPAGWEQDPEVAQLLQPPPLEKAPDLKTDLGRRIEVHTIVNAEAQRINAAAEDRYNKRIGFETRLIRTAEPAPQANCHGWVFAGGRYWIQGDQVDAILADNGYRKVDSPQVGDVVVYRDAGNDVLHSGVVRLVYPNGKVVAESKWGRNSCFLHDVKDHIYGNCCQYYRSPRGKHLLNGVEEDKPYQPQGPPRSDTAS